MIHIEALLGPMSHCLPCNGLYAHISAVFLQPVVVDCSEGFGAFAAEVMSGELDV